MNYKIIRIAKYIKKGKESIISIPYEKFTELVEQDPCLFWYEDLDERFKNRQSERTKPAIKKVCVYNYKPIPSTPDFRATYIEGTDDILARVFTNFDSSFEKLKAIAKKLNANFYS